MKIIGVCGMTSSFALAIAAYTLAGAPAKAEPDISGTYWATSYSPKIQVLGGGEPPLNVAGKAAYEANQNGLKDGSVEDKARHVCLPDGVPRLLATPYPFEVFQVPSGQVTFVFEMNHQVRVILLDKPLPSLDSIVGEPRYNGHSVGHWDGDTLVVESTGFFFPTYIDATGLPHSEEMTTIERIRKVRNTLEDIITIHDPATFTRDWQARFVYDERNDVRLEDYACNDRHRDLAGVKGVASTGGPALAAEATATGAPPKLDLSAPGVAWAGFVFPPKELGYATARLFNDYAAPATGIGPVTDDPAHPYANNEVARELHIQPTYRVANLDNAAAKNLMPWVREALAKQNGLVLQGRNGEPREPRCWETGVPAFHLNPAFMHIIQTPKEVVLFLVGRVRHIWLNVPHSANPKPSWYGESVGHYEGDTLVVDTIGFNDRTFVDSYRTPHTDKLHVVERFRLIDDGNTLEVAFTVEDPGAFYQPWSGTRNRHRAVRPDFFVNASMLPEEFTCPESNDDYFNIGLEPIPTAEKRDF